MDGYFAGTAAGVGAGVVDVDEGAEPVVVEVAGVLLAVEVELVFRLQ